MKCFTSYYSGIRVLPEGVVPISIAGWPPEGWTGPQFKALAPKRAFFLEWKKNHDNGFYAKHFQEEVLRPLNPREVWSGLLVLSGGAPFALCCYERSGGFCHRHLVSEWLRSAGYDIAEFISQEDPPALF